MNYIDHTGRPLAVAHTSEHDEAEVLDAALQFYISQNASSPVIWWSAQSGGFTAHPAEALENSVDAELLRAGSFLEALKGVESCQNGALFVLVVPARDANA